MKFQLERPYKCVESLRASSLNVSLHNVKEGWVARGWGGGVGRLRAQQQLIENVAVTSFVASHYRGMQEITPLILLPKRVQRLIISQPGGWWNHFIPVTSS